jgi:hypothetical protein
MQLKKNVFWDVAPIVLMMEVVNTSETSINFYQATRRNIMEDSHLLVYRRENLLPKQNVCASLLTDK